MGGRHTALPHNFDAHGLKITSFSPKTYMAQRWLKLDNFNHKCPRTPDAGLQLWVEVVGDVGDVDGQLMTHGVVVAVAVDDWYWR